ncbi:uncharacterized protein LY79DRAFT_244633 [Colletotrichum navitas]|uniref:Uncharacterized protein n=1 Tax=Colletotrichum navitas TaxID=681940 RepID=A0AAD8PXN4_9PEZI|nr:uncharacterized protein LY79DRAFT_244633 [Colletotrichum navitas]KAK1586020.1 hypothetical protein LY79DRAFT_244633 [Colletotrichum navitas]
MTNRPFLLRRVCRVADRRWISLDSLRHKTSAGNITHKSSTRLAPMHTPLDWGKCLSGSLTDDRWASIPLLPPTHEVSPSVPPPPRLSLAVAMLWLENFPGDVGSKGRGSRRTPHLPSAQPVGVQRFPSRIPPSRKPHKTENGWLAGAALKRERERERRLSRLERTACGPDRSPSGRHVKTHVGVGE